MKFVWDTLTPNGWNDRLDDKYSENVLMICYVGDLCFEIKYEYSDEHRWLAYDCYIGGIDDGYGYGIDNYPYTYGSGGDWDGMFEDKTFDEFKIIAEMEFADFIRLNNLENKANEPLHIW